jgi:hypothetical protein
MMSKYRSKAGQFAERHGLSLHEAQIILALARRLDLEPEDVYRDYVVRRGIRIDRIERYILLLAQLRRSFRHDPMMTNARIRAMAKRLLNSE